MSGVRKLNTMWTNDSATYKRDLNILRIVDAITSYIPQRKMQSKLFGFSSKIPYNSG